MANGNQNWSPWWAYEPAGGFNATTFLTGLYGYLRESGMKEADIEKEINRVRLQIGQYGFGPQIDYYYIILNRQADISRYQQQLAPAAPTPTAPGVTGAYEMQTLDGYNFAILRDDTGNVVDTINLGKAEAGGLTPSQQAELNYMNQQLAWQQQQWAAEFAYQQQQSAYQAALAQAQMQQQAGLSQAQMGLEAQLGALPYGQMTAYQLAEAQQAYQQYQAEMRANPTRWIQSYYAQQQPEPWYMGLTPTAPAINIPQIPTTQYPQYPPMPPVDWEALLSGLLPLLQPPTPPTKAEVYKQATPTQKKAIVQKAAVETIGRPLSTVFPYGTSATYKGG